MTSLNLKSFAELVSDQIAALQGRVRGLVDLSVGSILRSLAESNAGVVMWIQQLIVRLLVTTRASTCTGEDLDSWMADFSFIRLSAVQATGTLTFSRFTATQPALIPVGSRVSTADGTQTYTVIEGMSRSDMAKTESGYDPGQVAYFMRAGVRSVEAMVRAENAGAAGNAQIGMVSVIMGSVPDVDTVTNTAPFSDGKDAESDDDFRTRFVAWISSLSRATKSAIGYALSTLQSGITYTLTENEIPDGQHKPGYFYAIIDDGSGKPDDDLLNRARRAIDDVRAFTVAFGVFGPRVIEARVFMVITTEAADKHAVVAAMVRAAIENYITGLRLGQLLSCSRLSSIAYDTSPLITNVTSVTLNGGTSDLPATDKEVIRVGSIVVS